MWEMATLVVQGLLIVATVAIGAYVVIDENNQRRRAKARDEMERLGLRDGE